MHKQAIFVFHSLTLFVVVLSHLGCSNQTTTTTGNDKRNTPAASPVNNTPAMPSDTPVLLPVKVTKETKNPLADLAAAASLGKPLYQANCALCHGDYGASDGLASSSYDPKPTDLTKGEVTSDPDGAMFLVIKNGKGKMPGMKRLTDVQIWQLVAYTRTLAKK